MRFFTLASLSLLEVLISAQIFGTSASTSDLMAEFAELPTSIVRIKDGSLARCTQLTPI